jgi:phosphatidylinositol kinase/protein kinase (PI-3  family)
LEEIEAFRLASPKNQPDFVVFWYEKTYFFQTLESFIYSSPFNKVLCQLIFRIDLYEYLWVWIIQKLKTERGFISEIIWHFNANYKRKYFFYPRHINKNNVLESNWARENLKVLYQHIGALLLSLGRSSSS